MKPKDKTIQARIACEDATRLQQMAEQANTSTSELLRRFIEKGMIDATAERQALVARMVADGAVDTPEQADKVLTMLGEHCRLHGTAWLEAFEYA